VIIPLQLDLIQTVKKNKKFSDKNIFNVSVDISYKYRKIIAQSMLITSDHPEAKAKIF